MPIAAIWRPSGDHAADQIPFGSAREKEMLGAEGEGVVRSHMARLEAEAARMRPGVDG